MGKRIGAKIRNTSKYIYIVGMIYACVQLLIDWINGFGALKGLYGGVMLRVWLLQLIPCFMKFGIMVFASYVSCLIIDGFGCIIESNYEKAQAAKELNDILARELKEGSQNVKEK